MRVVNTCKLNSKLLFVVNVEIYIDIDYIDILNEEIYCVLILIIV